MNKKNLSIVSLLALSVALLGGCNKGDKNVNEIVLQVDGKKYTADQLYNHLLSTGTGANEAFSIVLRLVVESSMDTNINMRTAADLAEEKFEEEVEQYATTNGVRVKDARKALLKEKGYESVGELKADVIFEQKLTRVSETYWENNKESFYDEYISNRLPYLVSHVLVKLDDNTNGNKIANNVNVSQAEAEKIHDVITRFKEGDTFSYVANHFSDDSGSVAKGGSYYMDTTTSFVDEFLYGTYIFDAYTEKVTEGTGESATTYFKWGRNGKYDLLKKRGFINESVYEAPEGETTPVDQIAKYYENGLNFVGMDIVEKLGEVANKTSTGDFHYIGYVQDEMYKSDSGVTEYDSSLNNLNSNYNAYARSIIFNRAFNKTGLSVIGYESKKAAQDAGALDQCVEIRTYDDQGALVDAKWVLAAGEEGNKTPIFFVAAKGSNNDVWLHFLNINVSSLQSEYDIQEKKTDVNIAKKYFTINPDAVVEESEEDDFVPYALDPKFNVDGTKASKKKLVAEIESYIKSYVTAGTGGEVGEESLLNFRMLEDYMKGDIDWANENLENAIGNYIERKRKYLNALHKNKLTESFNKHADKLEMSKDALVTMGIKPYECAVLLDSDAYAPINSSTSTGNLCRYVYGKGYQVRLSYYYHTNLSATSTSYTRIATNSNDVIYFDENKDLAGGYLQWVDMGENYTLPTPKVKTGYRFDGWYTTSDFKEGTEVTNVDLTTSGINHHTIFYAKVVTVTEAGDYKVNYKYKFVDSDREVNASLITAGTNPTSIKFGAGEANKGTINPKLFNATKVEVLGVSLENDGKYSNTAIEAVVDGTNHELGVDVYVYVKLKPVTLSYKYVTADGNTWDHTPDNDNPTTYTFNEKAGESNKLVIDEGKIICGNGYKVKEIKYSRNEDSTLGQATAGEFTVEQTDAGTTIIVFVVVEPSTSTGTNE